MPSTETVDGRRTDTRQRIVEAAMQMFGSQGYARTTVAEIERAVGLRPGGGGLYRHFASKDDVLLEATRGYASRVHELRTQLAAERDAAPVGEPEADLRALIDVLATFLAGEQAIVRLDLDGGALPEAARAAIGAAWDDGYGMAADLFVRHGVPADRADAMGVAAIGALEHYFVQLAGRRRSPGGVEPGPFVEAWVEQWCALVAGAPSEPST